MRRPTQHHRVRTTESVWLHPYTGVTGLDVFYNDGGDPPTGEASTAPAGDDPADPPKPKAPATRPGPADGELIVRSDWLEQKLTAEKDSGRRNGNQRLAADLGFPDVNGLRDYVAAQKEAEQAQLSETERRAQELEDRERKLAEAEARTAARERVADRRSILVGLGATGDDLDDATALLRVENDATDDDVTTAAEALKARRPELFGVRQAADPAATKLPPAPGGAPAGGPPHRAPATKDDVEARARQRAEQLGLRRPAA